MAKDIISKPLLKATYIDNRNGDKVLYLEVPEKISRSMVVNEVEGSGKHFESTLKYIDKENTPNKLKEFSNLYEQNIGLINGITAEYLIDLSETIDVDLFKRAIEIATDKGKCSLGYIKGIIKQWLDVNIKTLEQLEAYKLQQQSKKGVKTNGSSTKRTKQFEQQIPADDEKDEEYYRLLEECERLSRE